MSDAQMRPADSGVDQAVFRRALGRFATGVAVITACGDGGYPSAMTVNSFTSVSLDPPLVLFCLGRSAYHFDRLSRAEAFAVNILGADQRALSDRFAREADDSFSDLSWSVLTTGSPILPGCLAALDCRTEMRHEAGDHLIVIGRVTAIDVRPAAPPLLYADGGYRDLSPCDG